MTPSALLLLALAAAAPQSPVADPREAVERRLGKAEVAYAECLHEAAVTAAVELVEPQQAMPRIAAACAGEWHAYHALLQRDRALTIERAPRHSDYPLPNTWALTFKAKFEAMTSNAYPRLLERAHAWQRCIERGAEAERCLSRERSRYETCVRAAALHPSVATSSQRRPVAAAMGKCDAEWEGLAVAARLASLTEEDRSRYRTELGETLRRMRSRGGLERHESCGSDRGCQADRRRP